MYNRMPLTINWFDWDLWPLTLKTFSAMPTEMMNMEMKLHSNASTKKIDIVLSKMGINERTTRQQNASAAYYWWRHIKQGSYRNRIVGFPDFSRTKLLLFADFSRHFVHLSVNKNITKLVFKRWNFLYHVFFYSKCRMGLKFLNFELQMLCVINCKKINKCMGNQQCKRHLHFPGQHFQGFSRPWKFLH